jgi:hypothetical protein
MTEKPLEQAVCARCGTAIDIADHFEIRAQGAAGNAFICRSEHIVAWVLRGAQWQVDRPWELAEDDRAANGAVRAIRVRSGESIERSFVDVDELRAWASSGGIWGEA